MRAIDEFGLTRVRKDQTPWLDHNGVPFNDDLLKVLSKYWSHETWSDYLQWLETPMRESQIGHHAFDSIAEQMEESAFITAAIREADQELKAEIAELLNQITIKQKTVLQMSYWHGLSEREIASKFGITRMSVRDIKKRAILKISTLYKKKHCPIAH
ncbi:MAG: hypothetical protein A2504_13015 [Bdellovibrionales bacterium RIFOXYD12_FULL_39_22]|nr:MAG: hypothetical protein A2385_00815 [Bdellovibrionales bacterium RIFOXYB1_FULL_39_21]OFZ43549.1 MAG: hypothetical protein A2485_12485 [Bdellovibrionales bacterium RIFOXYC12_FULL_39_17]OFZ44568.1 MAG: hypothetical protein A2404_10175 [Bdellovibrionales bacterium RIFOXYC1_FULL_39_130]OFZ71252.1 MAG: hypothetical protein A2451_12000 [Bdellovibrionales bacterium RIFOXYC2_FULL_39_8]OFZ76327.1 MAG: hypothetical protein A2560_06795 [Bdellovibrionales bacterium RIFOXYD1_FULL_39_84]OFZ94593.1 MAG: